MNGILLRATRSACLLIVACVLSVLAARADVVNCGPDIAMGTICLSGDVFDGQDGPLLANKVYVVVGTVQVPDGTTLSVNGATVKFLFPQSMNIRGSLSVQPGSTFTSIHDDSAGGDTNTNGGDSSPAQGDWGGLRFFADSDASVVDGAEIRWCGTGISLASADITIRSTRVFACQGDGLDLTSSSFPTVSACAFESCREPVVGTPLRALPGFTSNTSAGFGDGSAISVKEGHLPAGTNVVVSRANSLNEDGTFKIETGAGTIIDQGATLTLQAGVHFKFSTATSQSVLVDGTLVANGASFTSIHDDTIGGDTNMNAGSTVPAPGDWNGFVFDSTSDESQLVNVRIHYGGFPIVAGPVLRLSACDMLLDTVLVTHCRGDALNLSGDSLPTVVNCALVLNGAWPAVKVPIEAVPRFASNIAIDNATSDALLLDLASDSVTGDVTLAPGNTFNEDGVVVLATHLTVESGASLTLGPGMLFKCQGGSSVTVFGTLTGSGTELAPIAFTSIRDDGLGGDTMKDGGSPQAAPGDWGGLVFGAGSSASALQGFSIRYAGSSQVPAAIALSSGASPTFADGVIELCAKAAMDLNSNAFPSVTRCDFLANDEAVQDVPIGAVAGFGECMAMANAKGDYLEVSAGEVSAGGSSGPCVTLSHANSLNGTGVLVFTSGIAVDAGACLVVDGGCILKMDHGNSVQIDGMLLAGSSGSTTVFTRIEDDDFGGDTKNDGSAGQASPGDWVGLRLGSESDGSVLDDVVIRYGGRLGDSLLLSGTTPSLTDVVVRDGLGDALELASTSFPTVSNCAFLDCDFAVNGVPIGAVPGFVDNQASGNTTGDYMRVTTGTLTADLLIEPKNSLNGGPIVLANNVTVPVGRELTIAAGTMFKWAGAFAMTVNGTLNAAGSQFAPVQFTSIHDDVVGGDTNKNGNASSPAPGDWSNLAFTSESDQSLLSGAIVKYGGRLGVSGIDLSNADVKILDTTVQFAQADGMDLSSNSFPQVRYSSFLDNGAVAVDDVPLAGIQGFHANTARGNALFDAIRVTSTSLAGQAEVACPNSLNDDGVFVVNTSLTVGAASRLILRQGVAFKFAGVLSVTVNGGLDLDGTGFWPVVLTSIRDDGIGGDTNQDGGATLAAPGDWGGVVYQAAGTSSRAAHATVRFAGATGVAGFRSTSNSGVLELFGVRVEDSLGEGFRLGALAGDAANLVALRCGTDGMFLTAGAFDVLFATVTGCGGLGIRALGAHMGEVSSSISFANTAGPISGFVAGEVFFSDVGPLFAGMNGNIDADPLFAGAAGGHLTLAAGSPCLNAGEYQRALLARKDRDERSRALDHDLSGAMLPDMGAYERGAYSLVPSGKPRAGEILALDVIGPPGVAVYERGPGDGFEVLDPYGFLLLGNPRSALRVLPVGQRFLFRVPRIAPAAGFAIQATVRSDADPLRGNVTEILRFDIEAPLDTPPGAK